VNWYGGVGRKPASLGEPASVQVGTQ
jgi:hypothetical protein